MKIFNVLKNLSQKVKTLDNSHSFTNLGNVSSSTPMNLSLPNLYRGLILIQGDTDDKTALYSLFSTSGGIVDVRPIDNSPYYTLTKTNNRVTITSSQSFNGYVSIIGSSRVTVL